MNEWWLGSYNDRYPALYEEVDMDKFTNGLVAKLCK